MKDADEVVFLLTADTDYKMNSNPDFNDPQTYVGKDPEQTTLAMMNNALEKGYDELLRNHKTDYTALFNRVINSNSYTINSDVICSSPVHVQAICLPTCKDCGTTIWMVRGGWTITTISTFK